MLNINEKIEWYIRKVGSINIKHWDFVLKVVWCILYGQLVHKKLWVFLARTSNKINVYKPLKP